MYTVTKLKRHLATVIAVEFRVIGFLKQTCPLLAELGFLASKRPDAKQLEAGS